MNKNIIDLGFVNITWYAFFIISTLLLSIFLFIRNEKIKKIFVNEEEIYGYIFYLIIFAFLGARIWYVIFSIDYYIQHLGQIIMISNGGLAIHGGILGGFLYTISYTRKKNINLLIITDTIAPLLLFSQSIGRWGNFINQEAHGPETTLDFLQQTLHLPHFIIKNMQIEGIYYHPTFLYESLWNLCGVFLIIFLKKRYQLKTGFITAIYLVWYGFIRILIEILRTDALMFFNIKIAILSSLIMLISGIYLIYKIQKGGN